MPYIPPSLRDKSEDAIKIVAEGKDNHFPSLAGTKPVALNNNLSYAEKAKEWEANRKALELKELVDAEVARVMAERKKLEDQEIQQVFHYTKREKVEVKPEVQEVQEVPVDEWTVVRKKVRKPKKEKPEQTEEEFNYDHLAEDQEEFVPT